MNSSMGLVEWPMVQMNMAFTMPEKAPTRLACVAKRPAYPFRRKNWDRDCGSHKIVAYPHTCRETGAHESSRQRSQLSCLCCRNRRFLNRSSRFQENNPDPFSPPPDGEHRSRRHTALGR